MWDGLDKRRFPRASYRCVVYVTRDGKEELIKTQTENIGVGGVAVLLPEELDLFTQVRLEVFLDKDAPPVRVRGTVVWATNRLTGIEFIDLSDKDRMRIKKIIEMRG